MHNVTTEKSVVAKVGTFLRPMLRHLAISAIPESIVNQIRRIRERRDILRSVKSLHPRKCPICGYRGYFRHFGRPPRIDALCPSCSSLERHRLFWLWFEKNGPSVSEPILHFAAEAVLEKRFRAMYKNYQSADLIASADLKLDIEKIDLPSRSYKTIICNHVLEHVDDRLAMAEIHRVLDEQGLFIVSVPIISSWEHTYENIDISDEFMREVHFGQSDHVRYYGRDFRTRLEDANFRRVTEVVAEGEDVVTYGLVRGESFFLCRKT